MLLAQAETMATGAAEMLKAQELMPYLKGTIIVLTGTSGFFFWLWQASEKARDAAREAELARLTKINERLAGVKE